MGYLQDKGQFYDYYESLAFQRKIKEKGIIQFLHLMKKFQDFSVESRHYSYVGEQDEEFKTNQLSHDEPSKIFWGDEFEGHIVKVFNQEKKVLIQPNLGELFERFEQEQDKLSFIAMPEFGSWMLETTPHKPYYHMDYNVCLLIRSVRNRVQQIQEYLPPDTYYLLLPVFPRLGTGHFSVTIDSNLNAQYMERVKSQASYLDSSPMFSPMVKIQQSQQIGQKQFQYEDAQTQQQQQQDKSIFNLFSESQHFDDRLINPHPRYSCLTINHRLRSGSKSNIKIPIFRDKNTNFQPTEEEPYPGFIYMDHLGFGMGNCSLQMTFMSKDIEHARLLYDQLAVIAPLFISLSAGSVIYKGKLADWDSKWDCLGMSVDDRQAAERDPQNPNYIPKSKYSSISTYISNNSMNLPEYNDIYFPKNEQIMEFARFT